MISAGNRTDHAVLTTMRLSEGTNWTPLSIAERMGEDYDREYVKSRLWTLERHGAVERVSRGLYRLPAGEDT